MRNIQQNEGVMRYKIRSNRSSARTWETREGSLLLATVQPTKSSGEALPLSNKAVDLSIPSALNLDPPALQRNFTLTEAATSCNGICPTACLTSFEHREVDRRMRDGMTERQPVSQAHFDRRSERFLLKTTRGCSSNQPSAISFWARFFLSCRLGQPGAYRLCPTQSFRSDGEDAVPDSDTACF